MLFGYTVHILAPLRPWDTGSTPRGPGLDVQGCSSCLLAFPGRSRKILILSFQPWVFWGALDSWLRMMNVMILFPTPTFCGLRTARWSPKIPDLLDQSGPHHSNPKEDKLFKVDMVMRIFRGSVLKEMPFNLYFLLLIFPWICSVMESCYTNLEGLINCINIHGSTLASRCGWPSLWLFSDLPSGAG